MATGLEWTRLECLQRIVRVKDYRHESWNQVSLGSMNDPTIENSILAMHIDPYISWSIVLKKMIHYLIIFRTFFHHGLLEWRKHWTVLGKLPAFLLPRHNLHRVVLNGGFTWWSHSWLKMSWRGFITSCLEAFGRCFNRISSIFIVIVLRHDQEQSLIFYTASLRSRKLNQILAYVALNWVIYKENAIKALYPIQMESFLFWTNNLFMEFSKFREEFEPVLEVELEMCCRCHYICSPA